MKSMRLLPIAALIGLAFPTDSHANNAAENHTAEHPSVRLQTVQVKARRIDSSPATERKNLAQIQTEMIRDNKDLVRYTPDVGLSDSGRHQKGFAVRGVESNRVGVSIDGVNMPDSEENSLYARYGNFNSSRLAVDPELVRNIEIAKGADSFNTGSGALGGGVNYQTLRPADILLPDSTKGAMLKNGYSSRNLEWTNTAALAADNGTFDGVLLYSQRRGHETQSAGHRGQRVNGNGEGLNIRGSARGIPDASRHRYHSLLAKAAVRLNENHRIGLSFNGQQGKNKTFEDSYSLLSTDWRVAEDGTKRRNFNLFYEYTPDSDVLALLKADADYQKTRVSALNHKGSHPTDWSASAWPKPVLWDKPDLENVYERQMDTRFLRFNLRADSQPLSLAGGEHRLSWRMFAGKREFENINRDDYYVEGEKTRFENTIQHPVKTTYYGFSLQDQIRWSSKLDSRIGLRYDHTKMTPQDLNAVCNNCDEKPAANTFSGWSGFVGAGWQFHPAWRIAYDLTSGYRVPSASEMYFSFKNGAATWLSSPHLKAERSTNHNLSLRGSGEAGKLDVNLYQTNYRHFLSEEQFVKTVREPSCLPHHEALGYCSPFRQQLYWHAENIDKARIRGIELSGSLNLDKVWRIIPEGWKLFGTLGYAKSRLSGDNSLLSTQPLKTVIGLDYENPNEKWGVFSRLTYLDAKKGKDAQYTVCRNLSLAERQSICV